MIIVCLTDVPPKLRGDLSKWLLEVNTGVFAGNVSKRVRELLWERICENIGGGRATMLFTAPGEQGFDFRVHNTSWKPADFDGLTFMRRPLPVCEQYKTDGEKHEVLSQAGILSRARKFGRAKRREESANEYVVVDLETTGLSSATDKIIEIGALLVVNGQVQKSFSQLVNPGVSVPNTIVELTGITNLMLENDGRELQYVLDDFLDFIGKRKVIGYRIGFDLAFLREACIKCSKRVLSNRSFDVYSMACNKAEGVDNYKLETVARSLGIEVKVCHRALEDCKLIYQVYVKLKEM